MLHLNGRKTGANAHYTYHWLKSLPTSSSSCAVRISITICVCAFTPENLADPPSHSYNIRTWWFFFDKIDINRKSTTKFWPLDQKSGSDVFCRAARSVVIELSTIKAGSPIYKDQTGAQSWLLTLIKHEIDEEKVYKTPGVASTLLALPWNDLAHTSQSGFVFIKTD